MCTAELLIFDRLKQLGIASFFWDTAPIKLFGSAIGKPLERHTTGYGKHKRHQEILIREYHCSVDGIGSFGVAVIYQAG